MQTKNNIFILIRKHFIPDDRKEKRRLEKLNRNFELSEERQHLDQRINNGVHMSAIDLLALKPRRARRVNHVVIKTDIPLPRKVWLQAYKILVKGLQEEKQRLKK